jgi:hypothetical protein
MPPDEPAARGRTPGSWDLNSLFLVAVRGGSLLSTPGMLSTVDFVGMSDEGPGGYDTAIRRRSNRGTAKNTSRLTTQVK